VAYETGKYMAIVLTVIPEYLHLGYNMAGKTSIS
jgi:hypothetical protein